MSIGHRQKNQSPLSFAHDELAQRAGHRFDEARNALLRRPRSTGTPRRSVPRTTRPRRSRDESPWPPASTSGCTWAASSRGSNPSGAGSGAAPTPCRPFLGCSSPQRVPGHSTLSRTRQRLPLEVHPTVFALLRGIVEAKGLLGRVLGADSTYLRADASMTAIVGAGHPGERSRVRHPPGRRGGRGDPHGREDARRLGHKRTGQRRPTASRCRRPITTRALPKRKDGRTRSAYQPEHVMDRETGAMVAAVVHPADVAGRASVEASPDPGRE